MLRCRAPILARVVVRFLWATWITAAIVGRVVLGKGIVILTVNARVGSAVCRCRARMYAAPIPLVIWIIVGIVVLVRLGKAIAIVMGNVRAV